MAIAVDPILCNILFTINLLMHLGNPTGKLVHEQPKKYLPKTQLPKVSVLLPTFQERMESILTTIRCLLAQTYPKRQLEVLFIVEPDDEQTRNHVEEVDKFVKAEGISSRILVTDGKMKMKPHALNWGLKEATGEIICVYDDDDKFDEQQIEMAVNLMLERGYDVVQPKIQRVRQSLTGNYLMLDTFSWNRRFLPTFYRMSRVFPLSGEGLFVRRNALDDVGGFPEVLTEDAYLSILLAEKDKKFGLLDSWLEELAPQGLKSHFKQRLRWFRGYLTCLGRVLKSKMPFKPTLTLLIPFLAPITCSVSLIALVFLGIFWITWALSPFPLLVAPWMHHPMYTTIGLYWSAFLAYIGNPIEIFRLMQSIAGTKMESQAWLALTSPLYWIFVGVTALTSFFKSPTHWGKTVR